MTRPNRRRARLLAAMSTTALLLAPLPTFAQPAENLQATSFLGRIVLGFGRARVAIDTPQAVSTLEQEDIDREQAAKPGDLLRTVPGATAFGGDRMTGQSFNIRGIGSADASDQNRVIVSVDGVQKFSQQYRMGQFFGEPELYRRVEVLRGPASSALYGSGALGGVVAFETKDAADFLHDGSNTALRLKAGGNTNGAGALGSVILAQRFGEGFEILAALSHRKEGDYRSGDGTRVTGSGMSSTSGLVKGTFRFGEGREQTLSFSLTRWHSDEDDANYSADIGADVFGLIDRKVRDETAQITWANPAGANPLLDAKVQLTFSRTRVEQKNATAPIPDSLFQDSVYGYRTLGLRAQNRALIQGDGWENYLTLGIEGSRQERTHQTAVSGPRLTHPEGTDRRIGAFLQNEFIWDDRLTAVLGLRADRVSLTPSSEVTALTGAAARSNTVRAASLALHYRLNENWAVFGSLAQTERAPSLDELFNQGFQGGLISPDLRAERARTVEAGVSYSDRDLFTSGDSLDLKLTAFSNRITDKIERSLGAGVPSYVNVARAHIRGIELEGGYDAEQAFGKIAYSRILGTDTSSGDRLNSTPADELVLELGGRAFDQTLDYGWRGTFVRNATRANGDDFPGYGVNDLFLTWRPDQGAMAGLEVQLAVNNVLDKQYRNILNGGLANNEPRRGRDVRLTVGRQFNW
ncbi:TonB-dependent receptor domain-containing protein [Roseinatronobacter bogoriensis]|nr:MULTISPECIES: TonB-dependent receptor [Rhodobaca]MBB4208458.1 hemoglobin/transferrin/lactoferrin receptor protein [Rhodobaca bogoriensis DSM 18756]TDW39100.1 hemoglobin/transferrin/lactoferrin receptor protein [Rhodobaca barguzinensis]TDY66419.1 hemoglobin/transferrin/lactoferrin receptor protein [Rhodobaca bogoriensis DSM 18756]